MKSIGIQRITIKAPKRRSPPGPGVLMISMKRLNLKKNTHGQAVRVGIDMRLFMKSEELRRLLWTIDTCNRRQDDKILSYGMLNANVNGERDGKSEVRYFSETKKDGVTMSVSAKRWKERYKCSHFPLRLYWYNFTPLVWWTIFTRLSTSSSLYL